MAASIPSIKVVILSVVMALAGSAGAAPQFLAGWSPGAFGTPKKSFLAGTKAYFAMGVDGLWIIDIANPASPALLGRVDTPGTAEDVVVINGYAYVADGAFGLQAVNVLNPSAPVIAGTTTLGSGSVNIQSLAVAGEFLFTVARNELVRLSLSSPAEPFRFGNLVGVIGSVSYSGTRLWVNSTSGANQQTTVVVNPTTMTEVGRFNRQASGFGEFFAGNGTVTYWSRANKIEVYDGSGSGLPVLAKTLDLEKIVTDLTSSGSQVYAAYGDSVGSLMVLDTSNALNPVVSGFVPNNYGNALSASATAVVSGSGYVFAPPTAPNALAVLTGIYDFSPSIKDMFRAGDRVFVALGHAGLRILDATSTPPLQELGRYDPPTGEITSVIAEGNLAYVTGAGTGFRVLNTGDPANPAQVGFIPSPLGREIASGHYRQSKAGGLICLTEPNGGLALVDVSSPVAPVIAGQIPAEVFGFANYPWNGSIRGSTLTVIAQRKVSTFDISNPSVPVPLATYPVSFEGFQANLTFQPVTWRGTVFVPGEEGGILAWDISNPAQLPYPSKAHGRCNGVCLAGDRLYAFDIYGGIKTYRLAKSPTENLFTLIEPEYSLPGALDGIAYDDLLYVSKGTSLEVYRVARADPQITAMRKAPDGPVSFEFYGRSGARYRLQKSADLQSWQDWQNFSTYSDSIGFSDPAPPPGPKAFYRALELSR